MTARARRFIFSPGREWWRNIFRIALWREFWKTGIAGFGCVFTRAGKIMEKSVCIPSIVSGPMSLPCSPIYWALHCMPLLYLYSLLSLSSHLSLSISSMQVLAAASLHAHTFLFFLYFRHFCCLPMVVFSVVIGGG